MAWINSQNIKNDPNASIYETIFTALTGQSDTSIKNIQSHIDCLSSEIHRNEKSINQNWFVIKPYWQEQSNRLRISRQKNRLQTLVSLVDNLHSKLFTHIAADPDDDIFWTDFLQTARNYIVHDIGIALRIATNNLADSISDQHPVSIVFYYSKLFQVRTLELKIIRKRIQF